MDEMRTIDAYMHVGRPRFGSAAEALHTCDAWGIAKAVLVLGPGVPDVAAMAEAQLQRPGSVRAMGVPFGASADERMACAEACLAAGAIGFRLQQDEAVENPRIMAELGHRGGWAYATDPLLSRRHTEFLLEWLAKYPQARVGAPHCLGTDITRLDDAAAEQLCRHPRFCAIFSRQGQCGSRESYPHRDLLPWVKRVVQWCSWERIMWGSEYPVLYWRGERIDHARLWIREVGVEISDQEYEAFVWGNAQRLLFAEAAPKVEPRELPAFLRDVKVTRPVFVSPLGGLALTMDVYEPLMREYVRRSCPAQWQTFAEWCVEQLRIRAKQIQEEAP